jgi:hypothetical protein
MHAMVCFVGRHSIAVGELPVNLRMKVGESGSKVAVEFSHTSLVGSRARLRSVVDEIVGEQLFENSEVSLTLNLFGISPDNAFCRFG